jgi:hypothetical protein
MSNKKILIAGPIKYHDLYDWCHGYLQQSGRTNRMNNILYALGHSNLFKIPGKLYRNYSKKRIGTRYLHSQIFSVKFPSGSTSASNTPTTLLRNANLSLDGVVL